MSSSYHTLHVKYKIKLGSLDCLFGTLRFAGRLPDAYAQTHAAFSWQISSPDCQVFLRVPNVHRHLLVSRISFLFGPLYKLFYYPCVSMTVLKMFFKWFNPFSLALFWNIIFFVNKSCCIPSFVSLSDTSQYLLRWSPVKKMTINFSTELLFCDFCRFYAYMRISIGSRFLIISPIHSFSSRAVPQLFSSPVAWLVGWFTSKHSFHIKKIRVSPTPCEHFLVQQLQESLFGIVKNRLSVSILCPSVLTQSNSYTLLACTYRYKQEEYQKLFGLLTGIQITYIYGYHVFSVFAWCAEHSSSITAKYT